MRKAKTVTITLDPADYERLEEQARRCGTSPDSLAQGYVRAGLAADDEPGAEAKRRATLAALDRLAELTADLPPVDAVRIARASRRELERRPRL
jgi:hypothetical protein